MVGMRGFISKNEHIVYKLLNGGSILILVYTTRV